MLKRSCSVAFALTVSFVGAISPAVAATPRQACASNASRTVIQDAYTRVFTKRLDRDSLAYYVCRFRANRRTALGDSDFYTSLGNWKLAGRYLAWVEQSSSSQGTGYEVTLFDTVGRRALAFPTGFFPHGPVYDLALNSDGALAWIDADQAASADHPPYRVMVRRRDGTVVTADSDASISPGSLALSRSHAYWVRGGAAQSLAL